MEENINIAAILKDKKNGLRLYSPIFGECTFCCLREDTNDICVKKHNGVKEFFDSKGLYYNTGEVTLFPSKEMREWEKFSWKKGDVLQNNDHSTQVIFDRFISDTYKMINCKYWLKINNGNERFVIETNVFTKDYFKVNEETRQCYINEIENRLCGKLNLETLEIEKAQSEFKDGDIVCISGMGYLAYGIIKSIDNSSKKLEYYVLNDMSTLKFEDWLSLEDKQIQPITETQQIILFDALAKENKAWDAENIQIVDLKQKVELKPFDKVLVRNDKEDQWSANIFSYQVRDNMYYCLGECYWRYCIPYEGNEHLLGTTKDVEG